MKNEKETRKKLLVSAKTEFMEKGYMSASLRNICKNAGVTTGALYFFFKDKEDLFAALVEEPLNKAYEVMVNHYKEEIDLINKGQLEKDNYMEDTEVAYNLIRYLYKYHDEFKMLLTKSQGSRFENCIDIFVEVTEKHYGFFADEISKKTKMNRIDDYTIHWISHMQIDTFVYMITHGLSEVEAMEHMGIIMKYFISGWYGMFNLLSK